MIYWFLKYILRRGFRSKRGIIRLGQLENPARSGTGALVLAQEKVRLEYLSAKENFDRSKSWPDFERAMISLLQLTSTNAVIQSLINEHLLELLHANSHKSAESPPAQPLRKSA